MEGALGHDSIELDLVRGAMCTSIEVLDSVKIQGEKFLEFPWNQDFMINPKHEENNSERD